LVGRSRIAYCRRMRTGLRVFLAVILCLPFLFSCAVSPTVSKTAPADLKILSRAEWGALPPVAEMKRHTPTRITIHHTATLQKPERPLSDKLLALQKFSQNAGTLGNGKPKLAWPDVPYHYYIAADGKVAEGREVDYVGDTNTEYDPTGHALVVLEGNFENEQPTEAQLASLRKLIAWLAARFHVPAEKIGGHKDFASTLCPGKNLQALLPELRAATVTKPLF
jgi:hypothetical protein